MASETEYKTVRGLTRGLQLLNLLNRLDGGADVAQLSRLSGLHRTTVRRLLETLYAEGYVRRSQSSDQFQLSMKVRELSEGFRDEQWIAAIAAPLLGNLLQEVSWPTDICTLDVDAMVVRETTHRFSRLSFHRSMVGRRLPPLLTATGKAYLAFCSEAERERVIDLLAKNDDEQGRLARDRLAVENLLRRIRHQGYGENTGEWESEARVSAIALPINDGEQVYGCLNLVYMGKAMTVEAAAQRYLPTLQRVVDRIREGIHERASSEQLEPVESNGGSAVQE